MAVKNIYVRKGDESFWSWAEGQAKAKNVPLSVWLTSLIRNLKYDQGAVDGVAEQTPVEILADAESRIAEVREMLEAES